MLLNRLLYNLQWWLQFSLGRKWFGFFYSLCLTGSCYLLRPVFRDWIMVLNKNQGWREKNKVKSIFLMVTSVVCGSSLTHWKINPFLSIYSPYGSCFYFILFILNFGQTEDGKKFSPSIPLFFKHPCNKIKVRIWVI